MATKPKKPPIDFTGLALVWDCETTAIPDWGQSAEKPEGHPYIVEIAAVLAQPDVQADKEVHCIVAPPAEGLEHGRRGAGHARDYRGTGAAKR